MITCMRLAVGCAVAGMLAGCATTQPKAENTSADYGYFLSFKQKGQLIGQGRIQDARENWYDVWIVPGYAPPMARAGKYMGKAGDAFGEYGGAKKYHDLAQASSEAFEWAYEDCLDHFIGRDLPRAWGRYWRQARERTKKRVFGWWFAYPWAAVESTVDPLVRVPLGVCGAAIGTIGGGVVVPSGYMLNSTAVGTWHFTANGVAVPAAACSWNTVIAPPMALVGQKPAPSRVDGFWVTLVSPNDYARQEQEKKPISDAEWQALLQWGKVLLKTCKPFEEQRDQQRAELDKWVAAARENQRTNDNNVVIAEKMRLREISNEPDCQKLLIDLQAHGMDAARISKIHGALRDKLKNDASLNREERNLIMSLLQRYPPATFDQATAVPDRPKGDPVENSIRRIQQMK
jgi:hypothetical protein